MKYIYRILIPLVIIISLGVLIFADYFRAKNLSISITSQAITDEVIIDSINMPGNGFAYIYQQARLDSSGGIFLGGTDFLTKGNHKNVKIKTVKPQVQKIDPEISNFTIKLIEDSTGERLIDTTDDKPFKSLFGFEYTKGFLSL